jgi:hypothetical protein
MVRLATSDPETDMTAARSIDLQMPKALLLRADEVIQ